MFHAWHIKLFTQISLHFLSASVNTLVSVISFSAWTIPDFTKKNFNDFVFRCTEHLFDPYMFTNRGNIVHHPQNHTNSVMLLNVWISFIIKERFWAILKFGHARNSKAHTYEKIDLFIDFQLFSLSIHLFIDFQCWENFFCSSFILHSRHRNDLLKAIFLHTVGHSVCIRKAYVADPWITLAFRTSKLSEASVCPYSCRQKNIYSIFSTFAYKTFISFEFKCLVPH